MPIRFACIHCGQRLSVGSHKTGKTAACPKCKQRIVVPAKKPEPPPPEPESPEMIPEPPAVEAPPEPAPTVETEEQPSFDFSSNIEVVYESASPVSTSRLVRKRSDEEAAIDFDRISLPRYVVFVQGALLAVVGIMCFLLGMAVGGAVSESEGGGKGNIPIAVSGTVAVVTDGSRTPDAGALVIFLPFTTQADEKGALEGIRPGDDPAQGVKFRDFVRILGGGLAYCDQRGQYTVQLPDRGRYYLLAISSNADPKPGQVTPPQEVAQMGQYLDLSSDPLAEFRYQWRLENLRGSQKANVNFD